MKAKHKRLWLVSGLFIMMLFGAGMILTTFKEHAVFFITPKDVEQKKASGEISTDSRQSFRLGGLVKHGSVVQDLGVPKALNAPGSAKKQQPPKGVKSIPLSPERNNTPLRFIITDHSADISVEYSGLIPSLFREGQGVVAEGSFNKNGVFQAKTLLAKHDEYYMPPEVVKALKESGRWQHEEATPSSHNALPNQPPRKGVER